MVEITTRRATIADFAMVGAIRTNTIGGDYFPQTFADEISNPDYIFLVAQTSVSEIVAYALLELTAPEASLIEIAVRPDLQRQGLAGLLWRDLLAMMQAHEVTQVILEVRVSNQSAISFYQKLGFFELSVRKHYYSNPMEDAVVLCWPRRAAA